MEYGEVVLSRRSIRGFKPVPVPKALIREVIEIAIRAPSSFNTQTWHFDVLTGEPLDRDRADGPDRRRGRRASGAVQ